MIQDHHEFTGFSKGTCPFVVLKGGQKIEPTMSYSLQESGYLSRVELVVRHMYEHGEEASKITGWGNGCQWKR